MVSRNDDFDTIVVPARMMTFQRQFLEEKCWYPISISPKNLHRLKYFAVYRVLPYSAITHIAEIDSIDEYKLKYHGYIINLKKDSIQELKHHVPIKDTKKAIQSPRYTKLEMILKAKTTGDLWY